MQQYNQLSSGKSAQQSHLSVPLSHPGNERGVRMLPGANGLGVVCAMNRCIPVSRPGFQGMASSPMLNSGSSSSMVGMPVPANMHTGAGSGQGSSMMKPRDALHVMRVSDELSSILDWICFTIFHMMVRGFFVIHCTAIYLWHVTSRYCRHTMAVHTQCHLVQNIMMQRITLAFIWILAEEGISCLQQSECYILL